MDMAKVHGDVFTIKRGREILIFVNSISAAKEALRSKGNDLSGRAYSQVSSLLTKGGMGVAYGECGPTWKIQHRVTSFGLQLITNTCSLLSLEEKICNEVDSLVARFKEAMKEPFDPKYKVHLAVVNSFCAILFGKSYKINDPEFYDIVELNNRLRRIFSNGEILDNFPFLRYFPVELVNDINEVVSSRDRLLKKKLQEHRSSFLNENIRDFTDALLKAVSDVSNESSRISTEQAVTDDNLIVMMMDVFFVGVDPVSGTLSWAIAYLISHPRVQMKLHCEMEEVIGKNRLPSLSDRSHLPYLEAVIHETLRLASPTPLSIPHRAVRNTRLRGFTVPKDSSVIFNLWAIHRDTCHWEAPDEFRPERFINAEGKLISLSSVSYLPFGCGSRACLGQSLAMAQLFLFLSRLIHEFKFSALPGCGPPSIQGTATVVREPKPFRILVTKR